MTKAVLLFNETNRIFYELPAGKIGKDGKIVIQHANKGNTCLYYAIKRILTTEQIRSDHGKLCSQRRKAITNHPDYDDTLKWSQTLQQCNELFFKSAKMNPKEATRNCRLKEYNLLSKVQKYPPEVQQKMHDQMMESQPAGSEQQWLHRAADEHMAAGYGLNKVVYGEVATIKGLMQILLTKGPLVVLGFFGKNSYPGQEPTKICTIGARNAYGWKKASKEEEGKVEESRLSQRVSFGHAIVLVGAQQAREGNFVYWIDPCTESNPNDPSHPRIFISRFETIRDNLFPLSGIDIKKIPQDEREVALYNPKFEAERGTKK